MTSSQAPASFDEEFRKKVLSQDRGRRFAGVIADQPFAPAGPLPDLPPPFQDADLHPADAAQLLRVQGARNLIASGIGASHDVVTMHFRRHLTPVTDLVLSERILVRAQANRTFTLLTPQSPTAGTSLVVGTPNLLALTSAIMRSAGGFVPSKDGERSTVATVKRLLRLDAGDPQRLAVPITSADRQIAAAVLAWVKTWQPASDFDTKVKQSLEPPFLPVTEIGIAATAVYRHEQVRQAEVRAQQRAERARQRAEEWESRPRFERASGSWDGVVLLDEVLEQQGSRRKFLAHESGGPVVSFWASDVLDVGETIKVEAQIRGYLTEGSEQRMELDHVQWTSAIAFNSKAGKTFEAFLDAWTNPTWYG